MFKKKFDHKNGEARVCKECGAAYHAMKPTWKCKKCLNRDQREIENNKKLNLEKKEEYPFNTKTDEADVRFSNITTALDNAWNLYKRTGNKSYVREHYKKQLKEIEENGIMKWIRNRKFVEPEKPKSKSKSITKREFPDTRGHYEY